MRVTNKIKKTSKVSTKDTKKSLNASKKASEKTLKETSKTSEKTTKPLFDNLNQALKYIKRYFDDNDYRDGYQFRHSEYFFIENFKISSKKKTEEILVSFRLVYKTKQHRVINNISWQYNYKDASIFEKLIHHLELDIMKNTSDPDRSDQVFNKRFLEKEFYNRNLNKKGWIIEK